MHIRFSFFNHSSKETIFLKKCISNLSPLHACFLWLWARPSMDRFVCSTVEQMYTNKSKVTVKRVQLSLFWAHSQQIRLCFVFRIWDMSYLDWELKVERWAKCSNNAQQNLQAPPLTADDLDALFSGAEFRNIVGKMGAHEYQVYRFLMIKMY